MRSVSCAELKKVDEAFLAVVREAVEEENAARSTKEGAIQADPKIIGERPCGETALDAPIVQAAAAAIRAFGLTPAYMVSSTDANIPMSLGIPAITIGRGGPAPPTRPTNGGCRAKATASTCSAPWRYCSRSPAAADE